MEMIVAWFVGCVIVGAIAVARNRSGFAWFVLALLLSPVLMCLLLIVLRRGDDGLRAYTAESHRNCPACAEVVRVDACKCKHCGSAITTPPC